MTEPLKRVLITGAAGAIGSLLADHLADRYDLRLHYHRTIPELPPSLSGRTPDIHIADVSVYDQIAPAMAGIDTVVHLAAETAGRAGWDPIRDRNIIGTYNVFESARMAGVKKIVFASTNHVMGMYDRDRQWPIYANQPVRPDSLYGVSKAFGEALGRYYVDQYGLSVICLRIGWMLERPETEMGLWMWLSHRDCVQVFARAIEAPVSFGAFYAISRNSRRHWDLTDTIERLGYRPVDDSEQFAAEILGSDVPFRSVE